MVWHHRRDSLRAYWKQQVGYGKAEALLERKWPEQYNAAGHVVWAGRLYGGGLTHALTWRPGRIYQGTWGTGLFQSLYQPAPGVVRSLPLMPEWYLVVLALAGLSGVGALWPPLQLAVPLLAAAAGAPVAQAAASAARASFSDAPARRLARWARYGLTALLHLAQALARLRGRLRHGLTPWRRRGLAGLAPPLPRRSAVWSERRWRLHEEVDVVGQHLQRLDLAPQRGGLLAQQPGQRHGHLPAQHRATVLRAPHEVVAQRRDTAGEAPVAWGSHPREDTNVSNYVATSELPDRDGGTGFPCQLEQAVPARTF
jgi:hypothetical protein